jgi:hypothetical protein
MTQSSLLHFERLFCPFVAHILIVRRDHRVVTFGGSRDRIWIVLRRRRYCRTPQTIYFSLIRGYYCISSWRYLISQRSLRRIESWQRCNLSFLLDAQSCERTLLHMVSRTPCWIHGGHACCCCLPLFVWILCHDYYVTILVVFLRTRSMTRAREEIVVNSTLVVKWSRLHVAALHPRFFPFSILDASTCELSLRGSVFDQDNVLQFSPKQDIFSKTRPNLIQTLLCSPFLFWSDDQR